MEAILVIVGFAIGGLAAWFLVRARSGQAGTSDEHQKLFTSLEVLKSDYTRLSSQFEIEKASGRNQQEKNHQLDTDNQVLKRQKDENLKEIATLKEQNQSYLKRGQELGNELAANRQKLDGSETNYQRANQRVTQLEKDDEFRRQEHSNAIASLRQVQEKIQRDRDKEIEDKNRTEVERIRKLKETWINHEEKVRSTMKNICLRHGVDYLDKVPFKGNPDNTLRINDEFIVFDAKSPGGDDLYNFPIYLRNQAESVSKYVKEAEVRREVFLVVPTNTLEIVEQFEYRLSDYTVYIISLDSLEPVILLLKKIEEYEFAEQLSPEERENICRVIGKFVHLSKRRIQIDGFFAKQFFELVYQSEANLSKEIRDKVVEFERAEKLNPPPDRRSKTISVKDLGTDIDKLGIAANQQGIITSDTQLSKEINKLPLYTEEKKKDTDQGSLFEEGAEGNKE